MKNLNTTLVEHIQQIALPIRKLFISITFFLISISISAQVWTQLGADLDGEADVDWSGWSVSMPDANTLAIGAPQNDGTGNFAGHVRVYTWTGSAWEQKGTDLDGEAAGDKSGYSLSMPDANTIAIGAIHNGGTGILAGHVRVYIWTGNVWVQKGADLDGEAAYDRSGYSLSMPDANTLAIGAIYNIGTGNGEGHVRVYTWNGNEWVQKGEDIDGEASNDGSGFSISMPDANTIAIGAPYNGDAGPSAGHVRVYTWSGGAWLQKGTDLDGEATDDESGFSVSMPDGNTVAIGAPSNDGAGTNAGHVRVYTWNGSAWLQKGIDIDGGGPGSFFGYSVSMPNSNTIAIGAVGNNSTGGIVRVYSWNGSMWQQNGTEIQGEAANDGAGYSLSMPDSNTLAIGAPYNDGAGIDAGHVRVFFYDNGVGITKNTFGTSLTLYPNPTNGNFFLDLGTLYKGIDLSISDFNGKLIFENSYKNTQHISIQINEPPGIYLLNIKSKTKMATIQVVKE